MTGKGFDCMNQNNTCMGIGYKKYLAWIPAIAMAVIIFCFSAQPADQSTETSDFVSQIFLWIGTRMGLFSGEPEQYAEMLEAMSMPVRKCAHISEYAVFHVTILYALHQWGFRGRKWLTAGFFLVFFYACTDEIHQLFVPGRSGQFTDVMIDCVGVVLITAGLVCRERQFCRRHKGEGNV